VRLRLELVEGESVGVGAEAVAEGARPEHQVERPVGAASRLERRHDLLDVAALQRGAGTLDLTIHEAPDHHLVECVHIAVGALAGGDAGEAGQGPPFVGDVGVRAQHGGRVVGHASNRQLVEAQVVVGAVEG